MSADPFQPRDGTDPIQPAEPDKPRRSKLDFVWLFLLGLSGFATFEGLMSLVASGGAEVTILGVIFSFTVVLVLIGAMGLTADRAFGKHKHELSTGARVLSGVVYAGCALFSLMLAFSWWWGMLGARGATDGQIDRQVSQVESNLGNARVQLRGARTSLSQLATISAERAKTEELEGHTCGAQGRGAGPVYTLRKSNAALFQQVSGDVGTRIDSLEQAMAASLDRVAKLRQRAANAPSAERAAALGDVGKELTNLAGLLNALAGDPGLAAYRGEMDGLATAFRTAGGHRDGTGAALTCLDPGIAAALDGASRSLGSIRPMPMPSFAVYEGDQATIEAMRRFLATLFGWMAREQLGEGVSGGNEYLAFALGILVDALLLWIAIERGGDGGSGGGARLRRIKQQIAKQREHREADHLLATDQAISFAASQALLESSDDLPFGEVLVEYHGRSYLIIPRIAPNEIAASKARKMLQIAGQLDRKPRSGVKELVRVDGWISRITGRHERRARKALLQADQRSAAWAGGSQFVWFAVSDAGMQNLACWIDVCGFSMPYTHAAETKKAGSAADIERPEPWLLQTRE